MTLTYTLPTAPNFTSVSLPTPISISVPALPTSNIAVEELSAESVNARLLAFAYEKYGAAIQSAIDGNLVALFDWPGDSAIDIKAGILKEQILRTAQLKCEEVLTAAAARGWTILPGAYKKQILDIELEAKQQLSEALFKLLEEEVKVSQAHREFALKAGTEKEAALFDHHHRVQMATLETVAEIAKNLFEVYRRNAEAFNIKIQEFEQGLQNTQQERELRLAEHEAFLARMDSIIAYEQRNTRDAELFTATVGLVDLENRLKLSEVKLAEIAARTSRACVEKYHAELQQWLANIEVIQAGYEQYRAYVKGVLYNKDHYVKRTELRRQQIESLSQQIALDKKQAEADAAIARAELQVFKNTIEEFSALLEQKKREYDLTGSTYQKQLVEYATTLQDALSVALNSYERALSSLETETNEQIELTQSQAQYNATEYQAWIQMLLTLGETTMKAMAIREAARLDAMANITTELEHTMIEREAS